jgi:hypothetical protein
MPFEDWEDTEGFFNRIREEPKRFFIYLIIILAITGVVFYGYTVISHSAQAPTSPEPSDSTTILSKPTLSKYTANAGETLTIYTTLNSHEPNMYIQFYQSYASDKPETNNNVLIGSNYTDVNGKAQLEITLNSPGYYFFQASVTF